VLGVLGCPNLTLDRTTPDAGALVIAAAGQGTWAGPLAGGDLRRLSASRRADPKQARVLRSVESGHTNVDQMGDVVAALGSTAEPVLMDSQAKYAVLAAGEGDLLFRLLSKDKPDYREKIWDQAAGALIIEEAGGRITDLDGKPLDFTQGRTLAHNRGIVASNGALHAAALEALRRVGA
jgi:3'(2'), 5'-bisphosphate nucleotidase